MLNRDICKMWMEHRYKWRFLPFFLLGETLRYSQLLLFYYKQPFALLEAKQVEIWYFSKVGTLYLHVNPCHALSCYLWYGFDSVMAFTMKSGSGCEVFHDCYIFPLQIKPGLICINKYNFFLKTQSLYHKLCSHFP